MASVFDNPAAFGLVPAAPDAPSPTPPKGAPGGQWDPAAFGLTPAPAAVPGATPAGMPPAPPGETPAVDEYGRPMASPSVPEASAAAQQAQGGIGRIGSAAVEAYQGTPPALTPEARAAVEAGGPVGRFIVSPLAQAAGVGLGAANALFGGAVPQALSEIGGTVSPGLGRDLNMLYQSLPIAGANLHPSLPRGPPPADIPTITVRPQAEPAAAGAAATSRDVVSQSLAGKSPGQMQRDFESQVKQTAADRAGPQGVDPTVYVPGARRTTAAQQFSVDNAVKENALRSTDPGFADAIRQIEKDSKEVVADHYHDLAGDPRALEKAHELRDEVTPNALRLFENEQPVDAGPVVKAIDDILAGPSGKRSAVTSVLNDVRDKLFNKQGEMETLPSQLYGARQNITDKLKLKSGDEASNARLAKAHLTELLDVIDPVISEGAPGFAEYLPTFRKLSEPINQMQFLQDQLLGPGKLTGPDGSIQFNRIQKLLEKIAVDRKAPGVNAAKSLTPEQLDRLIAIRNEVAASHYRDELARAKGSNTAQLTNAAGMLGSGPVGKAVKQAADIGTQAALYMAFGVPANAIYQYGVKPAFQARQAAKTAKELSVLKNRLLDTSPQAPP